MKPQLSDFLFRGLLAKHAVRDMQATGLLRFPLRADVDISDVDNHIGRLAYRQFPGSCHRSGAAAIRKGLQALKGSLDAKAQVFCSAGTFFAQECESRIVVGFGACR